MATPSLADDGQQLGQEAQAQLLARRQFEQALHLDAQGRHDEAANALRQACTGGHVPAMTFLAGRLLTGRGAVAAPADGVALLSLAAQSGSADANTMMATLAGAGVGMAQSWTAALDHLQRAAELGAVRAQGQLLALAGRSVAPRGEDWAGLRQDIDLAPWMEAAPKHRLSEQPRLRSIAAFTTPAICDWLIARGRQLLRPATTYDPKTGEPRREDSRSNSAAEFDIVQADVVILLIRAKIAATLGVPVAAMETAQVLHYAEGQEFAPHFDYLDLAVDGYAKDAARLGQRIATFLLYLNDGFEGGETRFPRVGLDHRGRKGDALYFANVDADARPDPLTLHAGAPPIGGEKWVLSQWIRDRGISDRAV